MLPRILPMLLLTLSCASRPPEGPPSTQSEAWKGEWYLTWTRPGWTPPDFTGPLVIGRDQGEWSASWSWEQSVSSAELASIDAREDVVRLAFVAGEDHEVELDLFRDGDEVHGSARWIQDGQQTIPWSRVVGFRMDPVGGPLVPRKLDAPWPVAAPEAVGLSEEALREVASLAARSGRSPLVVVKGDHVVLAVGDVENQRASITSVSKAVSSLAVPFLLAEDKWPSVDASIGPAVGWAEDDPRAAITLRHVLTHTTGLETPDYRAWLQAAGHDLGADVRGAKLLEPPGTTHAYSNRTIELLSEVVGHAAGEPLDAYLQSRLVEPLELDARWYREPSGHTRVHAGMSATAMDLAKIGVLLRDDGKWEGTQVLPAGWVTQATSGPATDASDRMGLGWFLLPDGGFQHTGDAGAMIAVLPEKDLVVGVVDCKALGAVLRAVSALEVSDPTAPDR